MHDGCCDGCCEMDLLKFRLVFVSLVVEVVRYGGVFVASTNSNTLFSGKIMELFISLELYIPILRYVFAKSRSAYNLLMLRSMIFYSEGREAGREEGK